MPPRLKALIQYVVIALLTIFLIWVSLQGIHVEAGENKLDYILRTWKLADKSWLMAMAVVAILSHVVRAMRWRMLIAPTGHTVKLSNSFLSLMVGYLVNLAVPRGGEVSRCYNLYKLEHVPVDVSFGTVVVERFVDLLCLLVLLVFAFVLESGKLLAFLKTLPLDSGFASGKIQLLGIGLALLIVLSVILFFILKKSKKVREFLARTWQGVRKGLTSILLLKNKKLFVFYSMVIWFFYFLMSYTVIMAFESTAGLGFNAVISLFGIGAIAMAVPLPGGTGSYHVLVPQGLVFLYSLPLDNAIAFTFIFHGWQTLIMIIFGGLSLMVTTIRLRKKKSLS